MSGGGWSHKRVARERERNQMERAAEQVKDDEAAGHFVSETKAEKLVAENAAVIHKTDGTSALFFKSEKSAELVHKSFAVFRPNNFASGYKRIITHQTEELFEIPITKAFAQYLERKSDFPKQRIRQEETAPENAVAAALEQFLIIAGRKVEVGSCESVPDNAKGEVMISPELISAPPAAPVIAIDSPKDRNAVNAVYEPSKKIVPRKQERQVGPSSNIFKQLYEALSSLPVATAANEIAESVLTPQVTILTAETGSGKTLYATSKLADLWRDRQQEGDQKTVLVLVPRRFLAMNAAKTIAELSGARLGGPVGYAFGRKVGDESCFSDETRLLFTTYGYALASKLLNKASVVVLDEVHEQDQDISVARAILHDRLKWGDDVKVLEMSATLNAERQAAYWQDVAPTKLFNVEGKPYPCERRHKPADSVVASIMELVQQGKKGILVFRPGIGDIRETAELLTLARDEKLREIAHTVTDQMRSSSPNGKDMGEAVRKAQEASGLLGLEIEQIYGELGPTERRRALEPPIGNHAKVLIGTNVIESGANIPWVDAGVSCGTGKQKNVSSTGAYSLDVEVLPQWRLIQQEGRVKRFKPGTFTLASDIAWEARPMETKSELERLPLTDAAMQAVRHNLDPEQLAFDPPLNPQKLQRAKKELMRLGLVDEQFKPTEAGKFVSSMPLTAEAGAMLWHAKQLGILKAALPLAALMMTGSIRFDYRRSHGMNDSSDAMDALKAFLAAAQSPDFPTMERLNINFQKFQSAKALFETLSRTIGRLPNCDQQQSSATEEQIRQCALAGRLNQLFKVDGNALVSHHHENRSYIHNFSVVGSVQGGEYAVARLTVPKPENGRPVTLAEDVALIHRHDLLELAKVRPDVLHITKQDINRNAGEKITRLEFSLHGDDVPFDTVYSREGRQINVGGRRL